MNEIELWNPLSLAGKANASDNQRWPKKWIAQKGWLLGIHKSRNYNTHIAKSFEGCSLTSDMNVPDSTRAFKCKRYPDGKIRKFKARFCFRWDQQIHGINYFETFAPVVSWTTVMILLILSVILGLDIKHVDHTWTFSHAPITEDVYVCMQRWFKEEGKVLKIQRSLYGLLQSPRNFLEHL